MAAAETRVPTAKIALAEREASMDGKVAAPWHYAQCASPDLEKWRTTCHFQMSATADIWTFAEIAANAPSDCQFVHPPPGAT